MDEEEVLLGGQPTTQPQEQPSSTGFFGNLDKVAGVAGNVFEGLETASLGGKAISPALNVLKNVVSKSPLDEAYRAPIAQGLGRGSNLTKGLNFMSRVPGPTRALGAVLAADEIVKDVTGQRTGAHLGDLYLKGMGQDSTDLPAIGASELIQAENERRLQAGEPEMSVGETSSMLDMLSRQGFRDDLTAPSLETLQQQQLQELQSRRRYGREEAEARAPAIDTVAFDPRDRPAIGAGMEGPRTDANIPVRPAAGQGMEGPRTADEATDAVRAALESVQAPAAQAPAAPASVVQATPAAPVAPAAPVDPVTAPISAAEFMQQSPGGDGVPAPQVISATPEEGLVAVIDPRSGDLVYADPATASSLSTPAPARQAPSIASIQADPFYQQAMRDRSKPQGSTSDTYLDDSMSRDARIEEQKQRPGETAAERDTRVAQSKTQKSASAAGRRYTDAQLRDMFPRKKDREAAKAKDRAGINPLTDRPYAEEAQESAAVDARIAELERRGQPDRTEFDIANQAAEQTAKAEGLQPGTPEYTARVNELRGMTLYGNEYYAPVSTVADKKYTAEQARELDIPYFDTMEAYNAADAAGELADRDGKAVIIAGKAEKHRQESPKKKGTKKRN